jgi:hypothetical protein
LSGVAAIISYVLAVVHLSMTLVTDMPFSLVKIVAHRCFVWVGCTTGGFRGLADWRIA